ncbi:amino acid ABC transporter ATP-binding protein [Williamsia soli]|uniref:amino acid ABC transporter ATP-binding protein n=1 Tax=Williamsia soli TaxID=364929 RepID=UPI00235066EF|nr:amino acid ABC transporter ATP-binding protein [Williamsia soli]
MTRPLLEIRNVEKSFGGTPVLRDVSLDVAKGEVVAIIGPSGSGKSTLLRTINYLQPPNRGFVLLDSELIGYRRGRKALHRLRERELLKQRSRIGFVFQGFNLFPHLTALENIAEAPVAALGVPKESATAGARDLLERVGLADKAHAYPRQLSGGQQQRVAIARALALDPELILFDEPTSALDPELVDEVLHVIQDLARAGRTLLIVTHEITFARRVADRVVFMDEGRIVETGTPTEILNNPQHPRTRDFLSRVH